MKLFNAFSLKMIGDGQVKVRDITPAQAREFLMEEGMDSYIGHDPTHISNALNLPVPVRRDDARLTSGELAIVAQYTGPRLPAGATRLPPDAHISFQLVQWFAAAHVPR